MSSDALSTTTISTSDRPLLATMLSRHIRVNTRLSWTTTTTVMAGGVVASPVTKDGTGAPSTVETVAAVSVVGCRLTTDRSNPAGKALAGRSPLAFVDR